MTNPAPTTARELLLICGMHRSGTSLVTKCFELFGYGLGDTLMEPSEDNPKGFFEDIDIVNLNDWLLRDNGSWWDAPVFCRHGHARWDERHLDAAIEMLDAKLGTSPRLAIKDPRVCLLLPFWREVTQRLGVPLRLCLVYRHPHDVAASLRDRNALPVEVGLTLIQIYWSVLTANTPHDSFVVGYEQFLSDPEQTLQRIGSWLAMPVNEDLKTVFLSDFLDQGLQHHDSSSRDLAPVVTGSITLAKAAEVLHALSLDQGVSAEAWQLAAQRDETAFGALLAYQLSERLALLERSEAKVDLLEHERAQLGFEVADIARQKADREAHIALLEKSVATGAKELEISQRFAEERVEALAKTQADFERSAGLLAAEEQRSRELANTLKTEVADKATLARQLRAEEANSQKIHGLLQQEQATSVALKNELQETKNAAQKALTDRQAALDNANATAAALGEKADWLFSLLAEDYGRLLQYEASVQGRIHQMGRRAYRLLTLQRGQATAYDNAVAAAVTFYRDHELAVPKPPPAKRRQIMAMIRYTLAHPVSSLRSMSPARFRKVLSVVRSSTAEDMETWVGERFPAAKGNQPDVELPPIPADEVLVFPPCEAPKVSILVPVYNEWVVTHRCLWSILQHTDGDYEVIVADDGSTDETRNIADYVTGITVVRQEENLRFLKNCNSAAKHARGEFLLLLNNDTTVTEGWLPPLLRLFAKPEVGIVGPKLRFPDGKLQEAGGIIWQDASGWNYGRADDPTRPQYSYVRETDYVSGAALMVRRSLWQDLEGFDETFAPAYYEDTDLCFAARRAGYQVLYQPASSVVHYEGVSNGTDLAAGQKQYQLVNQQRFLDKWQRELDAFHFPNGEQVNWARDRSRGKTSVLVIDHYVPHYDKDAGSRSTWMYIELMVEMGWRVQFIGANFFPHQPYTEKLQQLGVEVLVGEHMARNLDKWLTENLSFVDHVFLHRPHIAEQFLPHLKKQKDLPPISYVGHDLHFLRTQREFVLTGDLAVQKEAARWQVRELAVIDACDHTLYFSEAEIDEVRQLRPTIDSRSIPLYVIDPQPLTTVQTAAPELLFVAGFSHPPNIDAATWFVAEILPAVKRHISDVHLHIAGSNPSEAVQALAGDGITVHGYVTDPRLQELYARASCAVVPLRFGAGVKGKVLEAIQFGVPLVTTSVGAEGIPEAERVMSIADDAQGFAAAVCEALQHQKPGDTGATQWLQEHFAKGAARQHLTTLVNSAPH